MQELPQAERRGYGSFCAHRMGGQAPSGTRRSGQLLRIHRPPPDPRRSPECWESGNSQEWRPTSTGDNPHTVSTSCLPWGQWQCPFAARGANDVKLLQMGKFAPSYTQLAWGKTARTRPDRMTLGQYVMVDTLGRGEERIGQIHDPHELLEQVMEHTMLTTHQGHLQRP